MRLTWGLQSCISNIACEISVIWMIGSCLHCFLSCPFKHFHTFPFLMKINSAINRDVSNCFKRHWAINTRHLTKEVRANLFECGTSKGHKKGEAAKLQRNDRSKLLGFECLIKGTGLRRIRGNWTPKRGNWARNGVRQLGLNTTRQLGLGK